MEGILWKGNALSVDGIPDIAGAILDRSRHSLLQPIIRVETATIKLPCSMNIANVKNLLVLNRDAIMITYVDVRSSASLSYALSIRGTDIPLQRSNTDASAIGFEKLSASMAFIGTQFLHINPLEGSTVEEATVRVRSITVVVQCADWDVCLSNVGTLKHTTEGLILSYGSNRALNVAVDRFELQPSLDTIAEIVDRQPDSIQFNVNALKGTFIAYRLVGHVKGASDGIDGGIESARVNDRFVKISTLGDKFTISGICATFNDGPVSVIVEGTEGSVFENCSFKAETIAFNYDRSLEGVQMMESGFTLIREDRCTRLIDELKTTVHAPRVVTGISFGANGRAEFKDIVLDGKVTIIYSLDRSNNDKGYRGLAMDGKCLFRCRNSTHGVVSYQLSSPCSPYIATDPKVDDVAPAMFTMKALVLFPR